MARNLPDGPQEKQLKDGHQSSRMVVVKVRVLLRSFLPRCCRVDRLQPIMSRTPTISALSLVEARTYKII